MPTILQINTTLNFGSTGRIAENIGLVAQRAGWRSVIAHGPRMKNPSRLETIQTNSLFDEKIHGALYSLLLDKHGLGSRGATERFIDIVKTEIKPDIIHLHNIHGYYINYEVLFRYLKTTDIPIIWTMHDCWSFTGHCANFDAIGCDKWEIECSNCPQSKNYPVSLFYDNSRSNYNLKKTLFTSIVDRLTIVPVSHFLESFVRRSFFSKSRICVIHNGVNIETFCPNGNPNNKPEKFRILGVASPWSAKKGLFDFYELRKLLPTDTYDVVLIGLTKKQVSDLPEGIIGIERTQNASELASHYSKASIFINPTYEDNYPTTNLEAIACGTPVITYRTGGSSESITQHTGLVVEQGNVSGIVDAIKEISSWNLNDTAEKCRNYAVQNFDMNKCFNSYLELYHSLINK